eukprot:SAG11_NODE_53_length_19648_cov_14.691902_18_plen_829_part_00
MATRHCWQVRQAKHRCFLQQLSPTMRGLMVLYYLALSRPAATAINMATANISASGDGGAFGHWAVDDHGLPVYAYTLHQDSPAGARIANAYGTASTFPTVRNASDHTFLFGNDRVTTLSSNYGYTQLRQDEGAPKLLNDVNRSNSQFGANNAIVTDAHTGEVLATSWSAVDGERTFGIGYRRVSRSSAGCASADRAAGSAPTKCVRLEHTVFAPKGDEPVLLSTAEMTNLGDHRIELVYSEAHSSAMIQLDFFSWELQQLEGTCYKDTCYKGPLADRRLFAATHYEQTFKRLAGGGLVEQSRFLGLSEADVEVFDRKQKELQLLSEFTEWVGPVHPALGGNRSSLWDTAPPRTFSAILDGKVEDGFGCSAKDFWGEFGPEAPAMGLACPVGQPQRGRNGALVLQRKLSLAPGESATVPLIYGYEASTADHDSAESVIGRYRGSDLHALFSTQSQLRKAEAMRFTVDSTPEIGREVAWNYGAAAAAFSYDDFFHEHILTQGTAYTYVNGFNSAARDPLQHALPFVFTRPELASDVLRYTLREMGANATTTEIPYSIFAHGIVGATPGVQPSDSELFVLNLAAELLLATKSTAILREQLPPFGGGGPPKTVLELLLRCQTVVEKVIGVGKHGMMRMQSGDWSDLIMSRVGISYNSKRYKHALEVSESSLNAAMASRVFVRWAEALRMVQRAPPSNKLPPAPVLQRAEQAATAFATAQRDSLRQHAWNGSWFSRAWVDEQEGWVGTSADRLELEPQSWAMVGGAVVKGSSGASVRMNRSATLSTVWCLTFGVFGACRRDDSNRVNSDTWQHTDRTQRLLQALVRINQLWLQ